MDDRYYLMLLRKESAPKRRDPQSTRQCPLCGQNPPKRKDGSYGLHWDFQNETGYMRSRQIHERALAGHLHPCRGTYKTYDEITGDYWGKPVVLPFHGYVITKEGVFRTKFRTSNYKQPVFVEKAQPYISRSEPKIIRTYFFSPVLWEERHKGARP